MTLPDPHFISTFTCKAIFSRYHTSRMDVSMLMLSRQCPGSNQSFTASLGPEGRAPLCPDCEIKIGLNQNLLFMPHSFQTLTLTAVCHGAKKPCIKYDVHYLAMQHHRCCFYGQQSKKHKRGTSPFKHAVDFIRSLLL